MCLVAIGLSHPAAPAHLLERAAVPAEDLPRLVDELLSSDDVAEALVLSTADRVEVYAVVDALHAGIADVCAVLAGRAGCEVDDLTGRVVLHYASAAVEHLLLVAAGLASTGVDVAANLGHLEDAYAAAGERGAVGGVLRELTLPALRVGRRVRDEALLLTGGPQVEGGRGPTIRSVLAARDRAARSTLDRDVSPRLTAEDVDRHVATAESADGACTVALRQRAAAVVDAEVLRLNARLQALPDGIRTELVDDARPLGGAPLRTRTVGVEVLARHPDPDAHVEALRALLTLAPRGPVEDAGRPSPVDPFRRPAA